MRKWAGAALLVAALTASGCSADEPEPVPAPPLPTTSEPTPREFDPELAPALAALTLVPAEATTLSVTDFDQVRLQLGEPLLTGASAPARREAFWRRARIEAPLLSTGRLRPSDARLLRDYGFTQDDVSWEATFTGPAGEGWVMRLRDDLDLTDLVGGVAANATYVERGCLPPETALGADAAAEPTADLGELEAWSVSFGGSLATVRLGPARDDVFTRLRAADGLPTSGPELARGFAQGVADPVGGRIGFEMPSPAVAARLTLERRLPFAVCPS